MSGLSGMFNLFPNQSPPTRTAPDPAQQRPSSPRGQERGGFDRGPTQQQQQQQQQPRGSYMDRSFNAASPGQPSQRHQFGQQQQGGSFAQSPLQQPQRRPYETFEQRYAGSSFVRREGEEEDRPNASSFLSRFGDDDEPLAGDPAWVKKPSRQRRFTNGTLPQVHIREEAALNESRNDFDDNQREGVLTEMGNRMDDMSGYVHEFAKYKEEEIALFEKMWDDEGNPIQQYDEDGNPIPFPDEDGYEVAHEVEEAPKTVTIDTTKFSIKEGWLWKKGSGKGLMGRKNWVRRYFKFDMQKPIIVFYYKTEPVPIAEKQDWETVDTYRSRRNYALAKEKRGARGWMRLMKASLAVPEVPKQHKNMQINGELVFNIVVPDGRSFTLAADTKDEFDRWVQTLGFVTDTMQRARDRLKRGARTVSRIVQVDEHKRDAALLCTAFGRGLFEAVAGQLAEFEIQAVDADSGSPAMYGGANFSVVLESRELHYDLEVVDHNDGTYTAKYVPTRVGTYELSIMLDDYDIQGSPFNPVVKPAPVSAPHCLADGAGLFCAIVGVVNQFTVHPRNSFNQSIVARGVPFLAAARAPIVLCSPDGSPAADQLSYALRDNGDGTYSCFYVVDPSPEERRRLGNGEQIEGDLQVTLDDHIHTPSFPRNIRGSPFRPVLAASATGAALAAAARHATMLMGSNNAQLSSIMAQFASLRPVASPEQQQQQQRGAGNGGGSGVHVLQGGGSSQRNLVGAQPTMAVQAASARPLAQQQPSPVPRTAPDRSRESWSYLPVMREPMREPDSFVSSASTSPDRAALEAEREQLLRLRRELQESRSQLDEHASRVAAAGRRVQADSDRLVYEPRAAAQRAVVAGGAPRPTRTPATPNMPDVSVPGFDGAVVALFNKHASALRRVFRHYAVRDASVGDVVRLPGLVRLAQDFDITPTFSSRKEVKDAFERAGRGLEALDFPAFVESLGYIAIEALGKPMFAHLYTTDAARVSVLLVMWGLGDPASLDAVVARDRYAA